MKQYELYYNSKLMEVGLEMQYMQIQQHISQYSYQSLRQEHNEQQHHPQAITHADSLQQAKEKLIDFVSNLHEHRKSQIRSDVLQHCEQVNRVKRVIAGYISDETIIRLVTFRIEKMVKNKKIKKNWSEDDVKVLVWVISKYCDKHYISNIEKDLLYEDWQNISQLIPGVSASNCMFKWLSMKKNNLSSFGWDNLESELLRQIIQQKQSDVNLVSKFTNLNWKMVAEELYFRNDDEAKVYRSAKQCREHWNCFLNPRLKKGPWLPQEDIQLLTLIKNNNGEKKWSQIVYSFQGRTENALKNRYTLLIEKQRRLSKSKQQIALIEDCLQRCYQQQSSRNMFTNQVIINPIQQVQAKNQQSEQSEMKELSSHHRSQHNTVSSDAGTPKAIPSKGQMRIHYLTSSQQLQFLQLIRSRSDLKRCCLKNGSFQIEP